jgi:tRNA pseudouridine38-40 synthase
VRKMYRYVIQDGRLLDPFLRKYAWFVRQNLNVEAMARASRCLVGRHDFRCFETEWPNRLTSVRTVTHLSVNRFGDCIWIDVEANGFLYNMVRAIAGSLVQVGRGFWPETQIADVLHAMDRRLAGPTAPPEGLFLMRVTYHPCPT